MRSDDTAKARAEAIFRPVTPLEKLSATIGATDAEREKMARLPAMRLARKAGRAK
jgi:hypothetical protein